MSNSQYRRQHYIIYHGYKYSLPSVTGFIRQSGDFLRRKYPAGKAAKGLIILQSLMSSANSIMLLTTQSGKSFTNKRNSSGPSTEPCVTQLSTSVNSDKLPFTYTIIVRDVTTQEGLEPL